jgi:hypothetical protein
MIYTVSPFFSFLALGFSGRLYNTGWIIISESTQKEGRGGGKLLEG